MTYDDWKTDLLNKINKMTPAEYTNSVFTRYQQSDYCEIAKHYDEYKTLFMNSMFDKATAMTASDMVLFDSMDDPIKIYRGCGTDGCKGISWTTRCHIARGFANLKYDGRVLTGYINKKDVIMYAHEVKNESEVICLYEAVQDVQVVRVSEI